MFDMLAVLLVIMFACLLLGFPLFMSMALGSLVSVFLFLPTLPHNIIIQQLMNGVGSFALLAIPMFMFAADIMCSGKTSNRLVDLMKSFFGHIHGGLGVTMVGTCTLFGAISGSTQATVVAIGKPMRGNMLKAGYRDKDINGLIVSAANIAMFIPPSVTMIMYCVVTGTSVGEMFIAGIGPGLLLCLLFSVYTYFRSRKLNVPKTERETWKGRALAVRNSLLPLGFPVVIVVFIYGGIASPTEVSAISVLYAIILEVFIYRSLKIRDLYKIALSTATITAALFILLAVGQLFALVLTFADVPRMLTQGLIGPDTSQTAILAYVTVFFFVACMFVDPLVAIVVLAPIFHGPAMAAGIDPIWLGIIIILQCAIGTISPPLGVNIFTASAAFDVPYWRVISGLFGYLLIFVALSIFLIFFPQVITFYRLFL